MMAKEEKETNQKEEKKSFSEENKEKITTKKILCA
jgi:hypothetical protein